MNKKDLIINKKSKKHGFGNRASTSPLFLVIHIATVP